MSNMNGGVMKSQRARVGAGYMPPARPFEQLPNPDSVIGQVYIASNVGPAPGIELIAAPGRWRPRGGRQVLAMRTTNPVTVQSLTNVVAESIGPFPGGLVRAGMKIFAHNDIACNTRSGSVLAALDNKIGGGLFRAVGFSVSSADAIGTELSTLSVTSDVNAVHYGRGNGSSYGVISAQFTPTINFSQPWSYDITLRANNAETAVNISSATWSAGIATFSTSAAHTLAVGDKTVIASVTPSGYNIPAGAIVLSVPTTTQFTVALAAGPGAYTSGGTSSRISNVTSQSYVLELVG